MTDKWWESAPSSKNAAWYKDAPIVSDNRNAPSGLTPSKPMTSDASDMALEPFVGFNKGLATVLTAPYRGLDWLAEKVTGGEGLPDADKMSIWGKYLKPAESKSKVGEYLRAGGEGVGAAAIPMAGTLAAASRAPAAQQATSTLGGLWNETLNAVRANPGAAVATDVAASTGSGIGAKVAEDAGFGATGQLVGSVVGAMVPGGIVAYRTPTNTRIGTQTGESLARNRANEAARDVGAFDELGVRTFGPAFNQGPVASVGKQITETPILGAPLKNNLDETMQDTANAAHRIAGDISPQATMESAGTSMKRGLDRYRVQGLDDLDNATVQGLGINPVQPIPTPQGGGRQQLQRINQAQGDINNITGGTVQNSRGQPVPLPQTRSQTLARRTEVGDLSDDELARVIRAPSDVTSFGARSEALYERAWRSIPPLRRRDGTADPLLLPSANSGAAARQIVADENRAGIRSGLQGRYGELFDTVMNPNANVPLSTLRQMRTAIGRDLSNFGTYDASLDRTQLRRMYGALSSDIEVGLQDIAVRAATRAGGNNGVTPEQARRAVQGLRDFQVADRYFRQGIDRTDRFMQVMKAENPQQVADRMIKAATDGARGNMRMFRSAMAALRPEERDQFASLIVLNMGQPKPGARGIVQEVGFSPSTFVTNYSQLSREARTMMFGNEHSEALDNLFRVANRLSNVDALANTSRSGTNSINLGGAAAGLGSVAAGNWMAPLAIGGGMATASILMSRPTYTTWMTKYMNLRAAVRDGSDRTVAPLIRHVSGLERLAHDNPALWPAYAAVASEVDDIKKSGDTGKPSEATYSEPRMLSQARDALKRGAPRKDVEDRLRQYGVDPSKLGP